VQRTSAREWGMKTNNPTQTANFGFSPFPTSVNPASTYTSNSAYWATSSTGTSLNRGYGHVLSRATLVAATIAVVFAGTPPAHAEDRPILPE
jgi:hypothetical protein